MQPTQSLQPPYAAPMPSSGGSGVGKMLGPIALVMAVVALAANFVVPGPQGPAGTNGTNGPNGTNGTNGRDGTNGTNGKDGTNGTNGTPGPRSMGATIFRSTDQTNWSVEVVSLPSGGVATSATLTILNAGGGTALATEALSSITYATDGAVFAGDGGTAG